MYTCRGITRTSQYEKAPGHTLERFKEIMKKRKAEDKTKWSVWRYYKEAREAFAIAQKRGLWKVSDDD